MDNGASGEIGGIARDAPSIQVITSPEVKHTEQDARMGARKRTRADRRAYAQIIDEVNKLDRRQISASTSSTNSAGALQR